VRFLRIREVMQVTGLSRMTIYRLEIVGKFPRRRQLSGNSVAWLESDIETGQKRAVSRSCVEVRRRPLISPAPATDTLNLKILVESSALGRSQHDAIGLQ
jgi:prophage regulatory protein